MLEIDCRNVYHNLFCLICVDTHFKKFILLTYLTFQKKQQMYFTIYQTSEACCVTSHFTNMHGHHTIQLVLFNFKNDVADNVCFQLHSILQTWSSGYTNWCYSISKMFKHALNVGNFKWFVMVQLLKNNNIIYNLLNFTNMLFKMCTFHFAYMVINWPYLLVLLNFKNS